MSYDFAALADKKQRRPPAGPSYAADVEFRGRLAALLTEKSSEDIVAEVAELGYKFDGSIIRKLNAGTQKASRVVGYICRRYDWPLPRESSARDATMGEANAALDEIRRRNPGEFKRLLRAILRSRDHERDLDDLEKPDTPENSNH